MNVELSALQSFIEEQRQWLQSVLDTLGWTKESLEQDESHLMQCPYNDHHFIAKSSVEKHRLRCRYGVVGVASDNEYESQSGTNSSTFVSINAPIVQAVKKYAATSTERAPESLQPVQQRRDFIDQSEVVVESHDRVTSLESQMVTPPDLLAQGHLHIIRYIKAWPLVPADFVQLSSAGLNPVEIKAWLFNNLPDKHSYSSQLGGEMQAVEAVVQTLSSQPSLTPDTVSTQLTSLFGQQCRVFVLRLWKFLHTAALRRQHSLLESMVGELTPLPPSAVSFLRSEETASDSGAEADSFASKIQALATEEEGPSSPLPPLPVECVPHILSSQERRLLYDYVVEVGGTVPGSQSKDPSLFRDDAATIKAKLKQKAREESEKAESEGGRGRASNLYQMKRERDYRRRRQKYRARNVHITRRTPSQVMRDIINARMLEISSSVVVSAVSEGTSSAQNQGYSQQPKESGDADRGTAKEDHLLEREERRPKHDSRSSHRRSEKEPSSRERSRKSKSKERLRKDSERSGSRERARKRLRSTSRDRRHSRHSDSQERHRHGKKSRDRERKSSKKSKHDSESSGDKSHHISRAESGKERHKINTEHSEKD